MWLRLLVGLTTALLFFLPLLVVLTRLSVSGFTRNQEFSRQIMSARSQTDSGYLEQAPISSFSSTRYS